MSFHSIMPIEPQQFFNRFRYMPKELQGIEKELTWVNAFPLSLTTVIPLVWTKISTLSLSTGINILITANVSLWKHIPCDWNTPYMWQ